MKPEGRGNIRYWRVWHFDGNIGYTVINSSPSGWATRIDHFGMTLWQQIDLYGLFCITDFMTVQVPHIMELPETLSSGRGWEVRDCLTTTMAYSYMICLGFVEKYRGCRTELMFNENRTSPFSMIMFTYMQYTNAIILWRVNNWCCLLNRGLKNLNALGGFSC